ncbi:hypothetical protein [Clostridium sp. C2-6-12]|uniref:hypothetical protein n=1 Tax=Clostridium sp. C2-6-12 TaxID=2698832 RepID=UPI00136871EB|nr:hypothetical protein [Clostridium sp. C2-6-12]
MENEKIIIRIIRYQFKIETIRKLIQELQQFIGPIELEPVSAKAIFKLERRLKKKLSDEYIAFLYYIGSGRLDYVFYNPQQVWEKYQHNCTLERYNRKLSRLENVKVLTIKHLQDEINKKSEGICITGCKDGAIPIMDQGCIGTVLLIIRGELEETVWEGAYESFYFYPLKNPVFSTNEGLPFATVSFLTWIEDYLKRRVHFYQIKKGK